MMNFIVDNIKIISGPLQEIIKKFTFSVVNKMLN